MTVKFSRFFIRVYQKFLEIFFDFDVGVYAFQTSKIPVNKLENFEYKEPIKANKQEIPKFNINVTDFRKPDCLAYSVPSLLSLLVLRDLNNEFYQKIKLKSELMEFFCVSKNYDVDLEKDLKINEETFVLEAKSHKSLKEEIQISKKLRTVEELLELEPYVNKLDKKEVREFSVTKYPVKQEKFTEKQIEIMKTQLAIAAKCKKYSITLEQIFDKIPKGLYSEIELNKDNTLSCKFEKIPTLGENQILVTGKRRYDTQVTKTLVKYSEIGF